jgi:hypothetical protein
MGAQGTTTIDFGTFPGASDASVAVTGQTSILSGSLVEAWLYPSATADHTADEHMVESIRVVAGNVQAGVGFTIYAFNSSQLNEPLEYVASLPTLIAAGQSLGNAAIPAQGGVGTRIYGQWTVAWVWN